MSSEAPEKSPLEQAKLEANELYSEVRRGLDSLRTAPINEFGNRIDRLQEAVKLSEDYVIRNIGQALEFSDSRIHDLEINLGARQMQLIDTQRDLRVARAQAASATAKGQDAIAKYQEAKSDFDTAELELKTLRSKMDNAEEEVFRLGQQCAISREKLDAAEKHKADLQTDLQKAKSELEEANRRAVNLQNDYRAAQQRIVGLQAELDLAKQQPPNLEDRLKAVEQRNAGLETDLRSATQRASTAEDELKTFKARFKLINDDMNALASSSEQQSTVTKPAPSLTPPPVAQPSTTHQSVAPLSVVRPSLPQPSFALPQHQQGTMEERKGGPQKQDNRVRTQSLDSHVSNSMGDKEPDLSHCQWILNGIISETNKLGNLSLFSPEDTNARRFLIFKGAKLGPMNLSIMKEKLARGAYTSSTSFKADFDLMVADCKRLNPPNGWVYTAAEHLANIFNKMWSVHGISSHESRDHISQDPESSGHKRKASTEATVSSEGVRRKKVREDTPFNHDAVQPPSSDTDEHIAVNPAVDRPREMAETFRSPAEVDVSVWEGHLTTGPGIDVNVVFNVRVERVSVAKPASTLSDWKSLLPRDLRVTAHARTQSTEEELFAHNFYESRNTMTLSLKPASGNDSSAFRKLSEYLISKDRFATISHQQPEKVKKIYLIPALSESDYPENILSLAHKVLPRAQKKNVMFMVILYWVDLDDRPPIRQAWSDIIKAVHSPDMGDLRGISDRLMQHPLPIYSATSMAVLSAEQYFVSMFSNIPLSRRLAESKVPGDSHRSFLNLSYPKLEQSDPSGFDGVKIPKSVFILGRVVSRWGSVSELLIVDIEKNDRPIWMIPSRAKQDHRLGTTIGLLTSKFPQSLKEWEQTITEKLRDVQLTQQLKDTGLQIERY